MKTELHIKTRFEVEAEVNWKMACWLRHIASLKTCHPKRKKDCELNRYRCPTSTLGPFTRQKMGYDPVKNECGPHSFARVNYPYNVFLR